MLIGSTSFNRAPEKQPCENSSISSSPKRIKLRESFDPNQGFQGKEVWKNRFRKDLSVSVNLGAISKKIVASGGFGAIYEIEAKDITGLGDVGFKHVIVKTVIADKENEREKRRLIKEGLKQLEIAHPHIVKVLGIDYANSHLVLEPVKIDDNLPNISQIKLNPEQVIQVVLDIASALLALHNKGVIHRDVKKLNVLLTRDDDGKIRGKLCDFGMAKIYHSKKRWESKKISGTFHMMAPELFSQGFPVQFTPATDMFSLAMTMADICLGSTELKRCSKDLGKRIVIDQEKIILAFNKWVDQVENLPTYKKSSLQNLFKSTINQNVKLRYNAPEFVLQIGEILNSFNKVDVCSSDASLKSQPAFSMETDTRSTCHLSTQNI